ncbi:hypothetical protein ANO14919_059680 [Xylariales sp. No.14919]|nr:hypothetical protein ANO14919_059680 [Xylariales sp. No.14919]
MPYYETPGHNISAAVVLSAADIIAVSLRFWVRRKHSQPLRPIACTTWNLGKRGADLFAQASLIMYGGRSATTRCLPGAPTSLLLLMFG